MKKNIQKWEKNQEKKILEITSLEDCYSWLMGVVIDFKDFLKEEEDNILGKSHISLGMWIRNELKFWDDCQKQTQDRSKLSQWFNKRGIYHPDDMSGIILTSTHRKFNNKDIKLEEQIEKYRNHWGIHDPKINEGILK